MQHIIMLNSLVKKLYKSFNMTLQYFLKIFRIIRIFKCSEFHEEVGQTEGKINLFYATMTIKKLIYHRTDLMQY